MRETETLSKQARHWALWSFVCAVVSIVIFLSIHHARNREFRQATEWHKIHGDVILVDGHKLSLPQDWWEMDEPENGKRSMVKAERGLINIPSSGISFDRKGLEESKASEDDIRKIMESFVEKEKEWNHGPVSSMIVVRSVSTNIYCMRSPIIKRDIELRCHIPGAPINLTTIGPFSTEKEIEAILSTFE